MNYKEKEKININFSSNKNLLSISINSYKEKYNERKSDIFFIIKITNNYSNKTWEIEKTITDFQNLYEKLFSLHPNLPLIPKKTIFKITSLHIMDKRKYELQNFLRFCIQRKDILLNNDFINFLEISQNFPELVGNVVEKKEEINLFEFSVLDFIYIKNKNLLIVLCINNDYISSDDMNIDNILTLRNGFIGEKSPLSHILIFEYKKEENKIIINNKTKEEKITEYKVLKLRNELLTTKLKEKETKLREIKKKCAEQTKKIEELKKMVTENILKQNKDNPKFNYEQKKEKNEINIDNKLNNLNKNNELMDLIETINFHTDTSTFFQCGICMDSFRENEKIKKLTCDHIFHIECMTQWLQTKKTCPFCDQAIFY